MPNRIKPKKSARHITIKLLNTEETSWKQWGKNCSLPREAKTNLNESNFPITNRGLQQKVTQCFPSSERKEMPAENSIPSKNVLWEWLTGQSGPSQVQQTKRVNQQPSYPKGMGKGSSSNGKDMEKAGTSEIWASRKNSISKNTYK